MEKIKKIRLLEADEHSLCEYHVEILDRAYDIEELEDFLKKLKNPKKANIENFIDHMIYNIEVIKGFINGYAVDENETNEIKNMITNIEVIEGIFEKLKSSQEKAYPYHSEIENIILNTKEIKGFIKKKEAYIENEIEKISKEIEVLRKEG